MSAVLGFPELFSAGGVALGAALGLLLLEIRTHFRLKRALESSVQPKPLARYPSVTVIRPVKGLDPGVAENMHAGLHTGYPGAVQTLFVFDDEREPAVPIARRVIAHHERDCGACDVEILFCGAPPPGRTGKLNAMIEGLAKARGELVAFADSDIRTDEHVLRGMVETLCEDPRTGSAFAPVIVSEPAHSVGDAVYALLLNGLYTPPACVAAHRSNGELPFILGQFMVMTRDALRAIGGLESVQGQLVDDLYMGQLMRSAGLAPRMANRPIRIVQYGLRAKQALQVSTRWFAFSRTGIPQWSFKLPIAVRAASFWLGLLGAIGFAAAGQSVLALACATLAALVTASVGDLHERVGGAPLRGLHRLAPALVYLVAPGLLLYAMLQRSIRWRGREYALDAQGRLAERPSR